MGYTKIVQYGNITEIYNYEKNLVHHKRSPVSSIAKKRARNIYNLAKSKGQYERSQASVNRSLRNFFRLCHHNIVLAKSVHFLTLTFAYDLTYKASGRYVSQFMERVAKNYQEIPLSYISVSEITKKGRYHYHILLFNFPTKEAERERETRNLQRLYQRGYLDISLATYTTQGIAGYMVKYMAKTLRDSKNEAIRGYNCSRNLAKFYSVGSNTLSHYEDLIVPTVNIESIERSSYDVPYLGTCNVSKIISIIN